MDNIQKCDKKLIKNWNGLVGLENDEYILEINTDMGCGWIRSKSDELLNSYGFNVEIDNWDKDGANG